MIARKLSQTLLLTLFFCIPRCAQRAGLATQEGVEAYRKEAYLKAAEAFHKALSQDPNSDSLNFYMGSAYSMAFQTDPGAKSSTAAAQEAVATFRRILERSPHDTLTLASLGSLAYAQAKQYPPEDAMRAGGLNVAKVWFEKVIIESPRDPSALYFMGVIESDLADLVRKPVLAKVGFPEWYDQHPIGNQAVRNELEARVGLLYTDAIARFTSVLQIEPQFVDAMMFLGRVISEKADLAPTVAEYERQTEDVDALFTKALSILKAGGPRHPDLFARTLLIAPAVVLPAVPTPPPPPPPK